MNRLPTAVPRVCDSILDFLLLAFAAWTVIYHVCLVLRVGTAFATVAGAVALVPCGVVAFRRVTIVPGRPELESTPGKATRQVRVLTVVNLVAAVGSAAVLALTRAPWPAAWLLWILAAGAAVVVTVGGSRWLDTPAAPASAGVAGTVVALVWAAALAVHALLLQTTSADDTYYVHLSSWVADHGTFPLRDTLFSDESFPAIIYPPISSLEALVGALARISGVGAPTLVYLVVAPAAAALSVFGLWRLIRSWYVPMAGVALSVALVFLFLDAPVHRAIGTTVLTRMWHGKVMLAAILVPLLYVLLAEYVDAPTRRGLVLLAAAGIAGVGLSSSGLFVVPVVALGCLAPIALRASRRAGLAFLATAAYPLAAAFATLAVGGRSAADNPYASAGVLVRYVLADGVPMFLAVTALLVAPLLLPRLTAARMTASTALLVGCLLTPPVLLAAFHGLGLGRVLWRLLWAIPTAALVGALAVGLAASIRTPVLRLAPAAVVCLALALGGTALWSLPDVGLAREPTWKRPADSVTAARWILGAAQPGDTVLAPTDVSRTIAVMSGEVTTVAPRGFYARALQGADGAYVGQRLRLRDFADQVPAGRKLTTRQLGRALRLVGVDLACVPDDEEARQRLVDVGYLPAGEEGGIACLRAPGRPAL